MTDPEVEQPAPPPSRTNEPSWAPDPWGRHERRWWDGRTWTQHVGDKGVVGSDPVAAAPVTREIRQADPSASSHTAPHAAGPVSPPAESGPATPGTRDEAVEREPPVTEPEGDALQSTAQALAGHGARHEDGGPEPSAEPAFAPPHVPPPAAPGPTAQPMPDWPIPGAGFKLAVQRGLAGYFRYRGRASRAEFWWFVLFGLLIWLGGTIVTTSTLPAEVGAGIWVILCLALLLPPAAAGGRRLHDAGFSGWGLLIAVVPVLGLLALCILWLLPGHAGDNQYGPAAANARRTLMTDT